MCHVGYLFYNTTRTKREKFHRFSIAFINHKMRILTGRYNRSLCRQSGSQERLRPLKIGLGRRLRHL